MAFRPTVLNPDLFEHVLSFLHVRSKGIAMDEDRRPAWMGLRLDGDLLRCRTLAKMIAVGHKRLFLAHGFQDSWGSQIRRHLKVTSFRHAASNLHHLLQGERENVIEDEEYEPCRSLRPNPHIGETDADMPTGLDDALNMRDMKETIVEFLESVGLSMIDVDELTCNQCYSFCYPDWEMTFEDNDGVAWTDVYSNVAISWHAGDWVATLRTDDGNFDLDSITALKPYRDCNRLCTSYEEACADTQMALACAHMRRLRITTLAVGDSLHMHVEKRVHNFEGFDIPTAIYKGFTFSGLTYRNESTHNCFVDTQLWIDLASVTRNHTEAAR